MSWFIKFRSRKEPSDKRAEGVERESSEQETKLQRKGSAGKPHVEEPGRLSVKGMSSV